MSTPIALYTRLEACHPTTGLNFACRYQLGTRITRVCLSAGVSVCGVGTGMLNALMSLWSVSDQQPGVSPGTLDNTIACLDVWSHDVCRYRV